MFLIEGDTDKSDVCQLAVLFCERQVGGFFSLKRKKSTQMKSCLNHITQSVWQCTAAIATFSLDTFYS